MKQYKFATAATEEKRYEIDDADYACTGEHSYIALVAITADRTCTMPSLADVQIGFQITFKDESGQVDTPQRDWTVACYGSDLVDGYSGYTFQSPWLGVTIQKVSETHWAEIARSF